MEPVAIEGFDVGQRVLGRYQLKKRLGSGSFGTVFEAVDTTLVRPVAVKAIRASGSRFRREAQAMARLQHPHVATVYDYGDHRNVPVIVTELLVGEDLAKKLEGRQTLRPARAYAVLEPIMRALAHAHDAGVFHRDIKPANIFIARAVDEGGPDFPKLLDFGIAKIADHRDDTQTQSGTFLGTPLYAPPEQLRGEADRDHRRADIWSLGVVWFEALSAERHFRLPGEETTEACIGALLTLEHARPLLEVAPGTPRSLALAIDRALEIEPSRRYRSVQEFRQAIVYAMDDERALRREVETASTARGAQPELVATRERPTAERPTSAAVPVTAAHPPAATSERPVGPPAGADVPLTAAHATAAAPGRAAPSFLPAAGALGVGALAQLWAWDRLAAYNHDIARHHWASEGLTDAIRSAPIVSLCVAAASAAFALRLARRGSPRSRPDVLGVLGVAAACGVLSLLAYTFPAAILLPAILPWFWRIRGASAAQGAALFALFVTAACALVAATAIAVRLAL